MNIALSPVGGRCGRGGRGHFSGGVICNAAPPLLLHSPYDAIV